MTPLAIYTLKENTHYSSVRNHRLIRAAYAKGLTNVTITRQPASAPGGGWWLKCDEYEKQLHLGYQVAEAETRINRISYTPPMVALNQIK